MHMARTIVARTHRRRSRRDAGRPILLSVTENADQLVLVYSRVYPTTVAAVVVQIKADTTVDAATVMMIGFVGTLYSLGGLFYSVRSFINNTGPTRKRI